VIELGLLYTAAIAILALFFVLLLFGWRRSLDLRRDLLLVTTPPRKPGLRVRALGKGTITLETPAPRQDIGHPGTLGLFWDGGYGQVGELTAVEGLRITREFRLMEGDAPPVCPETSSEDCPEVNLDAWAYPTHPGDAGLEFEESTYTSPLGPMGAWLVPARGARRWALHVHGLAAGRREAIRLLPALHRAGLTSMVIDYRNDPGAPSDPTGRYRFGLEEWADVEAAVSDVLARAADDVVLVGYSTGGSHIMSYLERSDLKSAVAGVVLDSPNVILAETVRHGLPDSAAWLGLPVGQLAAEMGMWIADHRWRIDWETTNYVARAGEILTMPTLVFHGTSDHTVPISVSRQLEARAPTVTLVETQAAGHVMSWNADPARYERHLQGFLARL
jgi:pimeloyl-ACP methyl ester carboxylesterase